MIFFSSCHGIVKCSDPNQGQKKKKNREEACGQGVSIYFWPCSVCPTSKISPPRKVRHRMTNQHLAHFSFYDPVCSLQLRAKRFEIQPPGSELDGKKMLSMTPFCDLSSLSLSLSLLWVSVAW